MIVIATVCALMSQSIKSVEKLVSESIGGARKRAGEGADAVPDLQHIPTFFTVLFVLDIKCIGWRVSRYKPGDYSSARPQVRYGEVFV